LLSEKARAIDKLQVLERGMVDLTELKKRNRFLVPYSSCDLTTSLDKAIREIDELQVATNADVEAVQESPKAVPKLASDSNVEPEAQANPTFDLEWPVGVQSKSRFPKSDKKRKKAPAFDWN
jgi:hypothetical protein